MLRLSAGCLGGLTPGGAMTPAASATPRYGADAADSGSVSGQTPAKTPMRDKLSINPDEDMYVDGDVTAQQQVVIQKQQYIKTDNNLLQ